MSKLFVYGTLKTGRDAFHLMHNAKFIRSCTTTNEHSLYALTSGFAGMIEEDTGHPVQGELFEVEDFKRLDSYEGISNGLFRRETIKLSDGEECFAYIFNRSLQGAKLIETGLYETVYGDK